MNMRIENQGIFIQNIDEQIRRRFVIDKKPG